MAGKNIFTSIATVTFLFWLFLLSPSVVLADWPIYRQTQSHTSAPGYTINDNLPLKWSSTNIGFFSNPTFNEPIVNSNGESYMATNRGLVALDKDGVERWVFTETTTTSPGIGEDGYLYFVTGGCNPKVYALSQAKQVKWIYDLRKEQGVCNNFGSNSSVGFSNDRTIIYVSIGFPANAILALNLDGTVRWQQALGQSPTDSSVAVGPDNTLYVGTGNNANLFALRADGTIKWQRQVGSGFSPKVGTPSVDAQGNVYASVSSLTTGDAIVSYDTNGNRRWLYSVPNSIVTPGLSVHGDTVYAVERQRLHAVNTATGVARWVWPSITTGFNLNPPSVDGNGTIITSAGNTLFAVAPTGTLKWATQLPSTLGTPVIADNNSIFVPSRLSGEGKMHKLGNEAKVPVIIIPGIMGSELATNGFVHWAQQNGHGGIFINEYFPNQKVWVDNLAVLSIDDDYFDILRMQSNGITGEADIKTLGMLEDPYQSTIDFFENNGYELGKSLFVFPYDWRLDNNYTSNLLGLRIFEILQQTGAAQVDIFAHSMGGLIARNFVISQGETNKVRKLVTAGTPYLGSVESIKNLFYGSCLKFQVGPFCASISPAEVKDIVQNMPSVFQLLPNERYYSFYNSDLSNHPSPINDKRDIDNDGTVGALDFTQTDNLLRNLSYNLLLLSKAKNFHDLQSYTENDVEWTIIAGSGEGTLGQIIEDYHTEFIGLLKIPKLDQYFVNGDGTVPLYSAALSDFNRDISLNNFKRVYYVRQNHGGLPKDSRVLNLALNKFNGNDDIPAGIQTSPFVFKGEVISVHSPVTLQVVDENGSITGMNEESIEQGIPGSKFDELGDAKFVYLPEKGNYVVKVKSEGTGEFDLKIKSYSSDDLTKLFIYKNISIANENASGELSLNTDSMNPAILMMDSDGNGAIDNNIAPSVVDEAWITDTTPPDTQNLLAGEKGLNDWYKSDVELQLKSTDNQSGVSKIEYYIDGEQKHYLYSLPLIITKEGDTKIFYKAIDNAGNEEPIHEITIKIDKNAPEASFKFDLNSQNIQIKGVDNLSAVTLSEVVPGDISLIDEAGNKTSLLITPKDKVRKEYITINELRYNNQTSSNLPPNNFVIKSKMVEDLFLVDLQQKVTINNQEVIKANYEKKSSLTRLYLLEDGIQRKEEKQGVYLLELRTLQGTLKAE